MSRISSTLLTLSLTSLGACIDEPSAAGRTAPALTSGETSAAAAATSGETKLCFPAAGQRVPVTAPSKLPGLLKTAGAGQHLQLATGTYGDDYLLDASGTATAPIVIEPAPGAVVTIRGTIMLAGSFAVVRGMQFAADGRILLVGHHHRITENTFTGASVGTGGIIRTDGNAIELNRIDHNEFRNFTGAAYQSDGFHEVDDNQGVRLDHNLFAHHTAAKDQESVSLMLTDAYHDSKLSYDHNLFDDVLNGSRNQAELVSIKTGGTAFVANTVINSPNVKVSLRQTRDSVVADNFLTDGAGIRVTGDHNTVHNNRVTGVGAEIDIEAGDGTLDDCDPGAATTPKSVQCKGLHPAAQFTEVSDNIGRIVVGHFFPNKDIPALRTTLTNNAERAVRFAGHELKTSESGIGNAHNTARALDASEVGVDAPDPSCP